MYLLWHLQSHSATNSYYLPALEDAFTSGYLQKTEKVSKRSTPGGTRLSLNSRSHNYTELSGLIARPFNHTTLTCSKILIRAITLGALSIHPSVHYLTHFVLKEACWSLSLSHTHTNHSFFLTLTPGAVFLLSRPKCFWTFLPC